MTTPHCVPDFAQLRIVPPPPPQCDYTFVAGSPDPTKSGTQGFFAWRHDSMARDNSGTVIKPNAIAPQAKGRWHRVFDGAVSVRWFGALGDGVSDDTAAIQATEDAASRTASAVFFPAGVYVINGAKNAMSGDSRRYGIQKRSRTTWIGEGRGSSILKLRDGSTSDLLDPAKTVDPQMVYGHGRLQDIGFHRLEFDLNGPKNPLTTLANVAALWLNGEDLVLHGLVIEDCTFTNGPGATVVLVQNRATSWASGYPLDDVLIINNRFENNCLSPHTNDHSTLNIWARRTRVIGNTFHQSSIVPSQKRYIQACAIEFHGGDGLFAENVIQSYGSVVIPSENFIEPWENLLVTNNIASDLGLWFACTAVGSGADSKPIDNIVLRGNHVVFNDYFDDTGGGLKGGLIQMHQQPISYLELSNNYFEMAAPQPSVWAVGVSSPQGTPVSKTGHLKVSDNTFVKLEFGAWIDNSNLMVQAKNVEFTGNTCLNMQDANLDPAKQEATGLWADGSPGGAIENLVVDGNRFLNEADNSGYKHGIELRSAIDAVHLGTDNAFHNLKAEPVWEQVLSFNARGQVIETSSQWNPGTVTAGGLVSTDVAVSGAEPGDLAFGSVDVDLQDMVVAASVSNVDTVTVTLLNNTAVDVQLGSASLFVRVTKPAF